MLKASHGWPRSRSLFAQRSVRAWKQKRSSEHAIHMIPVDAFCRLTLVNSGDSESFLWLPFEGQQEARRYSNVHVRNLPGIFSTLQARELALFRGDAFREEEAR